MSKHSADVPPPLPENAARLLELYTAPDIENRPELQAIYGDNPEIICERTAQIARALTAFLQTFGDQPVQIVRAPGRVNLRGMHVDTHGGWLNLMTHQREIAVVFAADPSGMLRIHNTDPAYAPVHFDLNTLHNAPAFALPWDEFVAHPGTQNLIQQNRGAWDNYLIGAAARVLHDAVTQSPIGLSAIVSGDIPSGAALSSSHALSVAMLLANTAIQQRPLTTDQLILAARDVEWFTGARTGTSDQAAILLGRPGMLVRAALLAEDFSTAGATWHLFPPELDLLVVHSHTTRNLSGEHKRAYTQNRFAYSVALDVLRQTLAGGGTPQSQLNRLDRLANITPKSLGGIPKFYETLKNIPEQLLINKLKNRYKLPNFDENFARYFAGLVPEEVPKTINLRGPLLFGICESERARHFAALLDKGRYEEAGQLMYIGHDGDRVRDPQGKPIQPDCSDAALDRWAREAKPPAQCPGAYAASSPVLDLLVDTARSAGALGACLTGAGIAGSILVLCRKTQTPDIARALRDTLATKSYAAFAKLPAPLPPEALDHIVMPNHSTSGAGFLPIL